MNFSLDFLYTFWITTALHPISDYFATYHIASHYIASPRLSSPVLHNIALHLATPRASYRIDQEDLPLPCTVIRYEPTNIITPQQNKKSLDRQIDIDLQDVHHGPSRTWPTFRWSRLPPRPGDRKDETLATVARFLQAGSGMVVFRQSSTLAGYRPKLEPGPHGRIGAGSS